MYTTRIVEMAEETAKQLNMSVVLLKRRGHKEDPMLIISLLQATL
jgi:hypothetical protein